MTFRKKGIKSQKKLIDTVKGFLDPVEGKSLYAFAKEAGRLGPCLEIGGYCGKSTIYLGTGCLDNNGILFSIDHHRGSEEQQPGEEYFDPELFDIQTNKVDTFKAFRSTIEQAGLEDTVVPVVCKSSVAARMWSIPLNLVFIDGGHSFKSVFTDYNCWARHIVPNGYLLIHDIFKNPSEGGQAPWQVYRSAVESGLFTELPMVRNLGVLRRRPFDNIPDHLF